MPTDYGSHSGDYLWAGVTVGQSKPTRIIELDPPKWGSYIILRTYCDATTCNVVHINQVAVYSKKLASLGTTLSSNGSPVSIANQENGIRYFS